MSNNSSSARKGRPVEPAPDKMTAQVKQLQEMFPAWSEDDLRSLLQETNSDVELAVARISEGHAEQWGSVTRKKDKRAAANAPPSRETNTGRERGDFRGGRGGGRGGRGGARGVGRGSARGGRRDTNGHHVSSLPPPGNGLPNKPEGAPTEDASAAPAGNGDVVEEVTLIVASDATQSSWDAPSAPEAGADNGWGTPVPTNWDQVASPVPAPAPVTVPPAAAASVPIPQTTKATKPGTTKMSWAQIARPQEKPVPPPPVAQPPAPTPAPVSVPPPTQAPARPPVVEPLPEPSREELTTVQSPIWDDVPHVQVPGSAPTDGWTQSEETTKLPLQVQSATSNAEHEQRPPSALPAQLHASQRTDKPPTPVSLGKPLPVTSRASARHLKSDQAVVMPSSSFNTVMDKVGMQFGSVNLGSDLLDDAPLEPPVDIPATQSTGNSVSASVEASPEVAKQPSLQSATQSPEAAAAPVIPTQPPLATSALFQQTPQLQQPVQQTQHISPAPVQNTQSLTPAQSTAISQTSSSISSPLQPFTQQTTPSQQHSMSPAYHQPSQQNQVPPQAQLHQQYSHHGFQSHIDSPVGQQNVPSAPSAAAHQGNASHGSYFRQHDQTYFHSPTPPSNQNQENPYAAFSPLAHQLQHQAQASHLSGFADQYGYDGSRGFYDSYGQPGFGNRNILGHDDTTKSIPATQQQPSAAAGINATASQASQPGAQQQQTGGQPQAAATQAQQGYAPVPYYYNPYPQPNQFYGPAGYASGYGLGQYNRYQPQQPPMFSPTASAPTAAPATKGPGSVQQQSNPYAQGLYTQQHSSPGYEDSGYPHGQLQHSQGVAGLPSSDYSKQLYGSHGAQGMQGFMSMGQTAGQNSAPTLGQRGATASSPENAYKPYAGNVGVGKDVGAGVGVSSAQTNVGQVQGRTGVQQPHNVQGGFYSSNRFSSNPTATGPQAHQTQQAQGHQTYPQGQNESGFYYARNQAGQFWQ